jgi:PAS domain S-box-containing protein
MSTSDARRFAPRKALQRRLNLTLLLPVLLTVLLAAALVAELLLLMASAGRVDHTDRVIAQARLVGNLFAAHELEQGPTDSLDHALGELGVLVSDNGAQRARYRALADAAATARGPADHAERFQGVLRQVGDFVAVEEGLRDERSHRERRLSRALVVATLLAALLLGGTLGLFARRQLHAVATDYEGALVQAREQALVLSEEERFRRVIEAIEDYAIFLLDPQGNVASWNAGAERGTGWRTDEILGQPFGVFFAPADRAVGKPQAELEKAARDGVSRSEDVRVRKDGAPFVAELTLTAVRDSDGRLLGFASVAREISERRHDEADIATLNAELQRRVAELATANGELEAFSYSVSHDLRGPLRAIDGFSKILIEQYRDKLDEQGQHYLARVRAGSQRMGHLIDDLLSLARINRAEMHRSDIDLASLARDALEELRRHDPKRTVEVVFAEHAPAYADPHLLRAALDNLVGNAWKFTGKVATPRIEIGCERGDEGTRYFVRDNGAGFDMAYRHKLFVPFQRLHQQSEFEGTGIGLATVQRIIARHGGRIWAESAVGQGATFWFTLGAA